MPELMYPSRTRGPLSVSQTDDTSGCPNPRGAVGRGSDVASREPSLVQTVATGPAPKNIAEHAGRAYVLNTGGPTIVGFRTVDGGLEPLDDATHSLA